MQNLQTHLIDCILQSWITIKAVEVIATKRIKQRIDCIFLVFLLLLLWVNLAQRLIPT